MLLPDVDDADELELVFDVVLGEGAGSLLRPAEYPRPLTTWPCAAVPVAVTTVLGTMTTVMGALPKYHRP